MGYGVFGLVPRRNSAGLFISLAYEEEWGPERRQQSADWNEHRMPSGVHDSAQHRHLCEGLAAALQRLEHRVPAEVLSGS